MQECFILSKIRLAVVSYRPDVMNISNLDKIRMVPVLNKYISHGVIYRSLFRLSRFHAFINLCYGFFQSFRINRLHHIIQGAGADGVIYEVHPTPEEALSDGQQTLNFQESTELIKKVRGIAERVLIL